VWAFGNADLALPDIDGDGVGDVVSSEMFSRRPTVKVLSGRTGRALWSVAAGDTFAAIYVPATGGKSVMLLLSETSTAEFTPAGGVATDAYTVTAANPRTGAKLWSTTITGVVEEDPTGLLVAGAGEFDGILTRSGATPYLLLDRFTLDFGLATVTTSVAPLVIDATTGNVVHPGAPLGGDDFTFATPVDDLNGDGVDDYLVCAGGDLRTVGARSGANGQPLWTTESQTPGFLLSLETSPDFSGDHREDLLLGWYTGDAAPTVHAMNGATGADVWTAAGDYGIPLGDLDHDGRSDTRVTTYGSRLTFTATSGTGKRLWSRDVLSPAGTRGMVWGAGDLDGDHVGEIYVEFVATKEDSAPKAAAIVTGRTGASRAVADLGWPLAVPLRGGAPSFVRGTPGKKGVTLTAYDGRTRAAFWRTVVKNSDAQRVGMLDVVNLGHGRVGLLALVSGRYTDTVALFDGRRGTKLWSMAYDTPGDSEGFATRPVYAGR
jgi:outer membrane protein assembly factor BamB